VCGWVGVDVGVGVSAVVGMSLSCISVHVCVFFGLGSSEDGCLSVSESGAG
jgi:hypothetical protein